MDDLIEYTKAKQRIFDHVGYIEDWRVLPIEDTTESFWHLEGEGHGGKLCYADSEEELESEDGQYYEDEIYTQRHLPKWVYRGEKYTMVVVDTNCDGNQLLRILDNEKEIK